MLIISNKPGQLGNRIFVFAHAIAFSIANDIKIINPSFDEYALYFSTTYKNLLCRHPVCNNIFTGKFIRNIIYLIFYYIAVIFKKKTMQNKWVKTYSIDWSEYIDMSNHDFIEKAKSTKYIFLQGWNIRDNTNFKKYASDIRLFFRPLPKYEITITRLIQSIRSKHKIIIGVHIRQGDYIKFENGKYYYTSEEYIRQINKVIALFNIKDLSFLICSNEQQDRELFNQIPSCYYGTGHIIEDMYALSKCDYIIGPPSTFTMWASFYGNTPLYMIKNKEYILTKNDFKLYI